MIIIEFFKFHWRKWRLRKTVGPWMRWSIDAQTRKEVLLNGFHDPKSETP